MSIINNPFSASGIELGALNIMSTTYLLQTYALAVISQADAEIAEIPSFVVNQQSARKNAEVVQTDLIPAIIAVAAHILGVSNLFSNEFDKLLADAKIVDNASLSMDQRKKAAVDLSNGIELLVGSVKSGSAQIRSIENWISMTSDLFKKDSNALADDLTMAEKLLKKEQIDKLQTELEDILIKMKADNEQISQGAVNGLVAAAQVSLGVVMSYYKGSEDGFNMIVAGIIGAAKESSEEQKVLDDANEQFQKYTAVIKKLLSKEAIYSVVKTLTHMDQMLFSNIDNCVLSLNSYKKAIAFYIDGLREVQETLSQNHLPMSTQYSTRLEEANIEWNTLHTQIVNFQESGIITNPKMEIYEKTSVS